MDSVLLYREGKEETRLSLGMQVQPAHISVLVSRRERLESIRNNDARTPCVGTRAHAVVTSIITHGWRRRGKVAAAWVVNTGGVGAACRAAEPAALLRPVGVTVLVVVVGGEADRVCT